MEKFNYGKDIFVLFCCENIYLQLIVMRITIIDLYNEINIQWNISWMKKNVKKVLEVQEFHNALN